MKDTIHLHIKKGYAAELIEDLVKADAVEIVAQPVVELTDKQKAALDKELAAIKENPDYLLRWYDVKSKYSK